MIGPGRLPPVARVRLTYQKLDRARFLGSRELMTTFVRACRRAGLPLAFSGGHHPLPRMSFGPALAVGVGSLGELVDVELAEPWSPDDVMSALNAQLPEGLTMVDAETVPLAAPSIERALRTFSYSVSVPDLPARQLSADEIAARVAAFDATPTFPVEKIVKGTQRTIDARPLASVTHTGSTTLLVEIRSAPAGTPRPRELAAAVLGLSPMEAHLLEIVKIGTTLEEPVLPRAAVAERARA